MATLVRGTRDEYVDRIKAALDEYESAHPRAVATLYRVEPAIVRVRVVDDAFAGVSAGDRHDRVWNFLSARLDEDTLQEIAILLLLTPAEQPRSFMNTEFDDPVASAF
jgi:stress-induced morphogen